ncbi:MAG: ABC transporter ATP-binding protein [Deltaproteobacteria bacterium]|nr:ABC transporter ATP-binding protein [Deltaproteobacteria bacterium]
MPELLRVENLKKYFPRGSKVLKAVDNVSFTLQEGETLGLVGESGSGKSTLGRAILRLHEPDDGRVFFEGADVAHLGKEALRQKRRHMQLIFQDPLASLNPQMTIGQAIEDPLIIHGIGTPVERKQKVAELLSLVDISPEFINSFPYEFSGGQQQRVGIARSLALNPKFIVCDEPVSALDVSIQAQIISLLLDLRQKFNLAYLFIAHDLGVIKYISDRIAVMYLGRIVQLGPKEELFKNPAHPYTKALISSIPRIPRDGKQVRRYETLSGEIPSPIDLPSGCRFYSRCPVVLDQCKNVDPEFKEISAGHWVACHRCN